MKKEITNVCFTGHRNINFTDKLKTELTEILEKLISKGTFNFYAGGACGWDMICELLILELREKYTHIKLHLILPCSNREQTAKWKNEDTEQFYSILALADSVEYISKNYTSNCMKKRNERLVELSDGCICYYRHNNIRSGTGQTVRMAERKNIPIYNLA